jgi:hypothetical protein
MAARRAIDCILGSPLVGLLLLAAPAGWADKPRVAVVFEEQVRGVFGLSGSWMDPGRAEETVIGALRDGGYTVVDSQTVRANILRDQAVQVLAGDQKAAVAVGSKLQAPWVVVGKGYAKSAGNVVGSSMKSMQASVQLSLMDAESGEIITSTTGSSAKPHVDEVTGGGEALAVAAAEAVGKLVAAADRVDTTAAKTDRPLNVTINGLRSYRHFVFLQEWIEKNAAGYQAIENEKYTAGTAEMDVRCGLSGHAFAKKIATATFQGFSVNPVDVSDTRVTLKVIIHE